MRWRVSRNSAMRGNAKRLSSQKVMPKTTSVQIIRPMPGWTRKLPDELWEAASRDGDLEEEGQQGGDEAVEEARLGQGEAEPLDRPDLVRHLRLTRRRLDDAGEDGADADT